jgi:hypothetical protein
VRSFISNSDIHLTSRLIPGGRWARPLIVAFLAFLFLVVLFEWRLAEQGFVPTIVDTPTSWARERARASHLGSRALILIGASRMQLDVDIEKLRDLSGMQPVQLAIDGSSFVSVLADLADDPDVTGTVLVEYQDEVVNELHRNDGSSAALSAWNLKRSKQSLPDVTDSEAFLTSFLTAHMRSYADGATPFDSLAMRAMVNGATPQYLITLPDRERLADYTKVEMPAFYYGRVLRNSGLPSPEGLKTWQEIDARLESGVENLPVRDLPEYENNVGVIAERVRRIEQRGGHVVFIAFPASGLVRRIEERRYPRERYWDSFARRVGGVALHFSDWPTLSAFNCPDGSHLDMRDRARFTEALAAILFVRKEVPPSHPSH